MHDVGKARVELHAADRCSVLPHLAFLTYTKDLLPVLSPIYSQLVLGNIDLYSLGPKILIRNRPLSSFQLNMTCYTDDRKDGNCTIYFFKS